MSQSLLDQLTDGSADAFQDARERRIELGRDIVAASYRRGRYVLSSGEPSDYYIDKYLFTTKPTVLRRLASLLALRMPADVDRIAGPAVGAVPLAAALSLETGVPFVIVRRRPKSYGTGVPIEGELHPGERVVVIEDVVSTATQALSACQSIALAGGEVDTIMSVVDREQGGEAAILAEGYRYDPLFRLSELPIVGATTELKEIS